MQNYCLRICIFLQGFLNLLLDFAKSLTQSVFLKPLFLKALDAKYLRVRYQFPPSLSGLCAVSKSRKSSWGSVGYYGALFRACAVSCNAISSAQDSALCRPALCSKARHLLLFPNCSHHPCVTCTCTRWCISWGACRLPRLQPPDPLSSGPAGLLPAVAEIFGL